jgi:hypothetical protein
MAVRIPMSPDPDGIIRLKCEDQELEIEVKAPQPDTGSTTSQLGGGFASGGSSPDKPWINPTDKPVVLMHADFEPGALLKSILADKVNNFAAGQDCVFVATESLDFHRLFELGKGMQATGFGEHFSVSFDSLGKRGGLG